MRIWEGRKTSKNDRLKQENKRSCRIGKTGKKDDRTGDKRTKHKRMN
jgi:hypothetical protein